jgi:hypothetical protein
MRHALRRQREVYADAPAAVGAVFGDLLDQSAATAFGHEHEVGAVRTLAEWRAAIPVRDYDGLRPYMERIVEGEDGVLTRSAPYALLKTSGTMGRPKLIPTTSHWRARYRGPALYAQWGLYFEVLGLARVDADVAVDLSWEPHRPSEWAGSLPVYSITQRCGTHGDTDWRPPWYEAPWFTDTDASEEILTRIYRKLRLLAGREVRLIVSVNPSKIVLLAEQLNERAEQLIDDLREGTTCGRADPRVRPDPELARRLEVARSYGRGMLGLTDLWPRLSLLVCWTSASARLYQPWLKRLVPGVPILPFSATGTEGIVTLPIDAHPSAGPLALDQGVYEFVPCAKDEEGLPLAPDVETVDYRELASNETYRLVMSQANGLYRYDTGDIYKVAGWISGVPRLEFIARAGFQSSFTGEKLTQFDVHAAVARVLADRWLICPLFTCIPAWGAPPRYVLAIEWTDTLEDLSAERLALEVDAALQALNIEYADKRGTHRLAALTVLPLVPGAFRRAAEDDSSRGVAVTQIKHHWVQRDEAMLALIERLSLAMPPCASAEQPA